MKKEEKSKIGHRKNEEKDEFESLMFMRGYPNHPLTEMI
jgi:hypothetical protein